MSDGTFDYSQGFEAAEATGNVRLGKLESMYEELFAEVIEDGVITTDERKQLDRMADSLGVSCTIESYQDRIEALPGSDFVLLLPVIRPGGQRGARAAGDVEFLHLDR